MTTNKLEAVKKLASHLAQTDRLRHIWIPDAPPHYPPVEFAVRAENVLKKQILKVREKRREVPDLSQTPKSVEKLLARSPVPPAVIAFTPRPTYFLPKERRLRQAVLPGGYLDRLRLLWPRLPDGVTTEFKGDPCDHVYKTERRVPDDGRRMPSFSGPGRLMLWTVFDLQQQQQQPPGVPSQEPQNGEDSISSSSSSSSEKSHEHQKEWAGILAQTTINLLDAEFGIKARADPTGLCLRVKRGGQYRKIAAIWPHVDGDSEISTSGVMLNVGSPTARQIVQGRQEGDKDAEVDIDDGPYALDAATSIAAELAAKPASFEPKDCLKSDVVRLRKSTPVRPFGAPSPSASGDVVQWYTRTFEYGRGGGTGVARPLGMDNYATSVAWSHELTRVLKFRSARVDHYYNRNWKTLEVDGAKTGTGTGTGTGSSCPGDDGAQQPQRPRRLPMRPRVHPRLVKKEARGQDGQREEKEEEEKEAEKLLEHDPLPDPDFYRTMWMLTWDLEKSARGKRLDPRKNEL